MTNPTSERPNIRAIAQKAGVSAAAVSYVLNGKPGVSAETRERVRKIIEENEYTPNMSSRRLAAKRSFHLLLITDSVSPLNNLFYGSVLSALAGVVEQKGYHLIVSGLEHALLSVRRSDADGLLLLHDPSGEETEALEACGVPYVVLDSHTDRADCCRVRADYRAAVRRAAEYLLGLGHRELCLFGRDDIPEFDAETRRGFRDALTAASLPAENSPVYTDCGTAEGAAARALALADEETLPTGIVCTGDLSALAAMTALQKRGIRVPERVSVVSVDDLAVSALYYPALTTVRVDVEEMAERGVELLERQMDGDRSARVCTISPGKLILRASAAGPAAGKRGE